MVTFSIHYQPRTERDKGNAASRNTRENISVTSRDGKTEFTFTMPLVN